QLLHGLAGALAVGLTFTFGARSFGPRPAFWGTAGLAATPLVPFLATRAYIDLFTVPFGLMALFGVLVWRDTGRLGWLRVAGAGAGLALATKYSVLALVAVLGAAVVVAGYLRYRQGSKHTGGRPENGDAGGVPALPGWPRRLARVLAPAAVFGGFATIFALPWYARQVMAMGSPVWPMYVGGRDWDATRVEQLTYFVSQYGMGHRLLDWLLLPWNVYLHSWRFGHVPESYPPVLALAAPLALLVPLPAARWLLALSAASVLLWARGWQDLRFLLGVYPALALLGAAGLDAAIGKRRWGHLAVGGVVAALCVFTAARQAGKAWDVVGVVSGRESTAAYLSRRLPDYRAIQVLNEQVPPGRAALFLGDGQIWYCRPRCIPDPAHDNLLQWFVRPGDLKASQMLLQRAGVSHILLSKVDYWYLQHQDPEDRLLRHLARFYEFKAAYLDRVYEDASTEVYRGRW
ncbi:MAG: glycosyltransferase family 39 protein, partial [Chloroflexota bacterium]